MIKELKMTATKDSIHLVDRFSMYDAVFNEYLETIKLIDDGKALMFENFQSLSRNYRKNVQVFSRESLNMMKSLTNKLDAHSLQKIATGLSNYITELNGVMTYVDAQTEELNQDIHNHTINKIQNAKMNCASQLKKFQLIN